VHGDARAITETTGVTFALDVVLNRDKDVVGAFGGDLLPMHAAACDLARRIAMQPVAAPFDVVVTTNSGVPARPEPVPVGQGDVRGTSSHSSRRNDHLCGGMP
jgi:nickel-dependent lactate racemase